MARVISGLAVLLLALAVGPLPGDAIYVRVRQGNNRCFIEMLEKNTVVLVTYSSPDQAPLPHEPEVRPVTTHAARVSGI